MDIRRYINLIENAFQSDDPEWQEAFNNQDWQEALYLSNSPEQIAIIIEASGAEQIKLHNQPLPLFITDDDIIEWDGKSKYAEMKTKNMWIWEAEPEKYFPNQTDNFNAGFWQHPYTLYHETTPENVESIQEHGIQQKDKTRGIGNRGVGQAVFTTANIENAYAGHYGGEIFKIDTAQMAADGYKPYACQEPQVIEDEMRSALAHLIGMEDFDGEVESGISEDTVILYGTIPPKYLKLEE